MKVVAIVGMAGAGQSEVARVFEKYGFRKEHRSPELLPGGKAKVLP